MLRNIIDFILLAGILCLSFLLVQGKQELAPILEKRAELEAKVGYEEIEDPEDKIYIDTLPNSTPLEYGWYVDYNSSLIQAGPILINGEPIFDGSLSQEPQKRFLLSKCIQFFRLRKLVESIYLFHWVTSARLESSLYTGKSRLAAEQQPNAELFKTLFDPTKTKVTRLGGKRSIQVSPEDGEVELLRITRGNGKAENVFLRITTSFSWKKQR